MSTPDSDELACAALPPTFIRPLQSQEAEEGGSVTLRCELSKSGVPVEWKKGSDVLKAGEKYQVKQEASVSELLIDKVQPGDSGDYSCVCGEQKTTASISIKGRRRTSDESRLTKAFFYISILCGKCINIEIIQRLHLPLCEKLHRKKVHLLHNIIQVTKNLWTSYCE
uniref:Ig-like domain-containing protein n=1 Tax=Salarias fasciatus TaxID=181472 RepID=A0A672IGF5_SALFA